MRINEQEIDTDMAVYNLARFYYKQMMLVLIIISYDFGDPNRRSREKPVCYLFGVI